MTSPKIYAFIFARGGSKGVPGKNIKMLAGKPLIAHAIEAARKSRHVSKIFVSTDEIKIAETARQYGAEIIDRPSALAGDDSNERDAWRHAIEKVDAFDIFVSVPATCPLRSVGDIDACIEKLIAMPEADTVFTVTRSHSNPYTTMIARGADGIAQKIVRGSDASNRQQAPEVFDIVGVAYATRPQSVMSQKTIWDGKIQTVVVPQERALDIDTEFDFKIAELLLKN